MMSRCVICNHAEFVVLDKTNVTPLFENMDYEKPEDIDKFFVCNKCGQIFWEGGQFNKAKAQYLSLLKEIERELELERKLKQLETLKVMNRPGNVFVKIEEEKLEGDK